MLAVSNAYKTMSCKNLFVLVLHWRFYTYSKRSRKGKLIVNKNVAVFEEYLKAGLKSVMRYSFILYYNWYDFKEQQSVLLYSTKIDTSSGSTKVVVVVSVDI